MEILTEAGIDLSRVTAITTDTVAANGVMMRGIQLKHPHITHIGCLAHIINLAVMDAVKVLSGVKNRAYVSWETLALHEGIGSEEGMADAKADAKRSNRKESYLRRCSNIVSWFHHSSQAWAELSRLQMQARGSSSKLVSYCQTRFNSAVDMIDSLHRDRKHIQVRRS